MSLSELKENREAMVTNIEGDSRFMSRIKAFGEKNILLRYLK